MVLFEFNPVVTFSRRWWLRCPVLLWPILQHSQLKSTSTPVHQRPSETSAIPVSSLPRLRGDAERRQKEIRGRQNNKVDNYHKLRQSVRAVSEGARQLVQRLMHDFHFVGLNDCLLCQFPAAITSESSFHCSISGSQFLLFVIGSNVWGVWCFRAFDCV